MIRKWLSLIVPSVSASELGFFRLCFGLGLAFVFNGTRLPDAPFPPSLHLRNSRLADWNWAHALAGRPDLVATLESAILLALIAFAVGLFARAAYTAAVAGLMVWTLVLLTHTGAHPWAVALVTVVGLLGVRWGDGFSLDALIRVRRGRPLDAHQAGPGYGFALWLPGLVVGTAMAGAAIAKLRSSGLQWITTGAVKYHFVVDARNAPVDWGLWVASHHWAAVLLSFGAILIEGSLVLAVFVPSYRWRMPFAMFGLALLTSFYVFQNEVWPAWWLLMLAFFLPVPAIYRTVFRRRDNRPASPELVVLTWLQIAAALIVIVLQGVASTWRIEVAPLMSDYPMYSFTFASTDAFDALSRIPPIYHYRGLRADGMTVDVAPLLERLEIDALFRDAAVEQREKGALSPARAAEVRGAFAVLADQKDVPVESVTVTVDQEAFDWQRGRFAWKAFNRPIATFANDATR